MGEERQYERPPIVEATIEVRLAGELKPQTARRVHDKFRSTYEQSRTLSRLGVTFDLKERASRVENSGPVAYRLTRDNETDVLQIYQDRFVLSVLAPYPGWPTFFEVFKERWSKWKSVAGHNKIVRLGMRYINRLDIPAPVGASRIKIDDYLSAYLELPDSPTTRELSNFAFQATIPAADIHGNLTLKSAIPNTPPMVGHVSIMLDIDLGWTEDVPQSDADIVGALDEMRKYKNQVFEAVVTDKSREIFGQ